MVPKNAPPDLRTGDGASVSPEQLFAALYHELHAVAERRLRGLPFGSTLSTTTLLHEAYLSLAGNDQLRFPDKGRFLSYASRAMRGLIIDYARRRSASKRGGEFQLLPLGGVEVPDRSDHESLSELGLALDELAKLDPALAELVDLHFFCGLSFGEIAAMREVSERTVQRDWRKARVILHHQVRPSGPNSGLPE
jgi:RNA polymerase sigma factor (TIGR02999 family)